ncbi:MAG TPA: hypothetical protein PKV16_04740 [Caldisericia bacterium]|mgnify:CR=1 FL=1|nr:hypothetical protein [Caldisericia bacterium]HPF48618.1 hypothetical protein [Caldisericia bacterium]HPI83722.1 hypothetical protein [Caldisericia bacterium]HPQ93073.1 hypothetical protein [Caldisericia bacterium]HRV75094.1 hypothetical protein [Caldisericia bacterium]
MTDKLVIEIEAKDRASPKIEELKTSIVELSSFMNENTATLTKLQESWKKAESGILSLKKTIDSTSESLKKTGANLTSIAKTIGRDFGASLTESISASLSDLPGLMFSWGNTAAGMFAKGLSQGSGQIESAAYRISDMLAGYFEMHSPARLGPLSKEDPMLWTKRLVELLANGLVSAEDVLTRQLDKIASMMVSSFDISGTSSFGQSIGGVVDSISNIFRSAPVAERGYSNYNDPRVPENILAQYESSQNAREYELFYQIMKTAKPVTNSGWHEAFTGGEDYEQYWNEWFTGIGVAKASVEDMARTEPTKFEQLLKYNPGLKDYYRKDEATGAWVQYNKYTTASKSPETPDGVLSWDEWLNDYYSNWAQKTYHSNSDYVLAKYTSTFLQQQDKEELARKYTDYVRASSPELDKISTGGWFDDLLGKYSDTNLSQTLMGSELDKATGIPVELTKTSWWNAFVRQISEKEAANKYGGIRGNMGALTSDMREYMGLEAEWDISSALKILSSISSGQSAWDVFTSASNMLSYLGSTGNTLTGGVQIGWSHETSNAQIREIASLLGFSDDAWEIVTGKSDYSNRQAMTTYNRMKESERPPIYEYLGLGSGLWDSYDVNTMNRLTGLVGSGLGIDSAAKTVAEAIAREWQVARKNELSNNYSNTSYLADSAWTTENPEKATDILISLLSTRISDYEKSATRNSFSQASSYGTTLDTQSVFLPMMFDYTQPEAKNDNLTDFYFKHVRDYYWGRDQNGNLVSWPREQAEQMQKSNTSWIESDYVDTSIAQIRNNPWSNYNASDPSLYHDNEPVTPTKTFGSGTSMSVGAIQVNQTFNLDMGGYEGSLSDLVTTLAQEAALEAQKSLVELLEFRGV